MITSLRGHCAALILLTSIAAGCPASDDTDDNTSVATTSDTDPSTTMTMTAGESTTLSTTDDPSTTEDPSTSTTDEPTTDTSSESTGVDTSGDGSTTEAVGLEIIGEWADEFGGEHVVTESSWATTFAPDTFTYSITEYDNAARWVIAQDDGDSTWTKYEWTYVDDDLWYCQSVFGEATAEDAMNAPAADPADPAASGCGGFAWSLLTPQA